MIAINDLFTGLALVLSVVSLLWQWWDKRPRLAVSARVIQKSLPTADPPNIAHKTIPVLSIYVANPGRVRVHVRDLWFELATGRELPLFEHNALYPRLSQPFAVDPLRGHIFDVNTESLIEELETQGYAEKAVGHVKVRDELGKHYKSKKVRFAVSDLRPAETDATQPPPD
ncbi:MAG: hypothetical protein HRF48_14655 [Chloroflexota bacterium]|jgi:hypothetical protein